MPGRRVLPRTKNGAKRVLSGGRVRSLHIQLRGKATVHSLGLRHLHLHPRRLCQSRRTLQTIRLQRHPKLCQRIALCPDRKWQRPTRKRFQRSLPKALRPRISTARLQRTRNLPILHTSRQKQQLDWILQIVFFLLALSSKNLCLPKLVLSFALYPGSALLSGPTRPRPLLFLCPPQWPHFTS